MFAQEESVQFVVQEELLGGIKRYGENAHHHGRILLAESEGRGSFASMVPYMDTPIAYMGTTQEVQRPYANAQGYSRYTAPAV